jgi:hypothetical protein
LFRPSSRGSLRSPYRPCRRAAAAGDAGHRARLGSCSLQVPPPPSPLARTHAAAPLFPLPHHPNVADARHAAIELQSAAPPACSVPFYTRTNTYRPHEPGTTTASTH